MKQPTVMDLFDKMENKELNNEKEELKIKKDKVLEENNIKNSAKCGNEQCDELDRIIEAKYGDEIYKTWKVKFIRPLITLFLKEKRPHSITAPEVNHIDIVLLDNKLDDIIPIEIQKSVVSKGKTFYNSQFENLTRKQIEDNIINYGKCWFFMDSEYLRYLQSENVKKVTSVNMTWLIELMKKETLKIFSIKYDGQAKELTTKDFDFLKNISQTCVIGHDNDERIVNRNKLVIFKNVINGYNFTQDEIDKFHREFDDREDKNQKTSADFFRKSVDERCKLYGKIKDALGELNGINDCLNMNAEYSIIRTAKYYSIILGLIESVGSTKYCSNVKIVDKFDVCKYFPGYLRQEKHWITYKGNEICGKTFLDMCKGFYKNAVTIFD